MGGYLAENVERWSRGYAAESVDHPVFRFYGRILKVDGPASGKLLDFGCGQGSAVGFFTGKGYDAYGVDVSEPDLAAACSRFPELADRFALIDPKPAATAVYYGGGFDVISAIQVLYYLNESDFEVRVANLHDQLAPGGLFYATMMGTESWYYERSEPAGEGLRRVELPERIGGGHEYVLFTESTEQLLERFAAFAPLHVGFYSEAFRSDEGKGFHYTFVGRRRGSGERVQAEAAATILA